MSEPSLNQQILDDDPESLAVDAYGAVVYEPDAESNVVAAEPKIISIGRGKRKDALQRLSDEQRNS